MTGGVVYAGAALPQLGRRYVYGDFCSGALWTLRARPEGGATTSGASRPWSPASRTSAPPNDGELLFASGNGALYRALPAGS